MAAVLVLALCACGTDAPAETVPPVTPEATASPTPVPTVAVEIPAPEPEDTALVRVRDYIPDIWVDLCYAGENNFTGAAIYDFSDAYLRYGTVKKSLPRCRKRARRGTEPAHMGCVPPAVRAAGCCGSAPRCELRRKSRHRRLEAFERRHSGYYDLYFRRCAHGDAVRV